MQFGEAGYFNWFWLIATLGGVFYFFIRRNRAILQRFAEASLLTEISSSVHLRRQVIKKVLIFLVFIFSVIALARPQWGFEWREIKRQGIDIILVIDTSKSMLTGDVKPNRLERTKLAVKDLVKNLKGDRVGLVAFSGKAFLVCPLTVDYNGFMLSLQDLDVETIPQGGTNLGAAIQEAIKQYDDTSNQYKAVVILTDGENLEADPMEAARDAKEKGIRIYTVGIGTKEGDLIRIPNVLGEDEFLKDGNGNVVKSRLNEKLLQDISLLTGGVYVRTSGAQLGLDLLYDRELSRFEKRDFESRLEKRYYERFQLPLTIAFFLLFFDTCLTTRKREN